MVNKDKLEEATVRALTEDTEESYTQRIEKRCKEENPEFYNVYEQLKQLEGMGKWNSVSLESKSFGQSGYSIHISLYPNTERDHELYGNITDDKICKVTSGSGPNPLEPKYLELLNKVSEILIGYQFLHY